MGLSVIWFIQLSQPFTDSSIKSYSFNTKTPPAKTFIKLKGHKLHSYSHNQAR